ncbi:hypothetical protein CONLIGDRAFT_513944 [Coniochaeta ligniaria NRRL 30616]|uniref:Uncharacterized protein n=1 Tax=Coniochaeta ligniaria NRRL 30616 TaxID=1408157 RepID=A0A1J7IFC1_9PEZI|nr:hypothetical protein CONLIGDRAFT_513944 [Coniochaeta ligniaria NRRL 30616]
MRLIQPSAGHRAKHFALPPVPVAIASVIVFIARTRVPENQQHTYSSPLRCTVWSTGLSTVSIVPPFIPATGSVPSAADESRHWQE